MTSQRDRDKNGRDTVISVTVAFMEASGITDPTLDVAGYYLESKGVRA